MTLDSIPKFCLTLPEKPTRQQRAMNHLAEHGIAPVHFVSGINAAVMGLRTEFPYEYDNPGSGFNIGPHCVGIWLSHWAIWQIIAHLPTNHGLILEDDAKFDPGSKTRINQALQDVPQDFDWLFLGSCCNGSSSHVKGEVWDVRYPMCFHAYVLSKNGAKKLSEKQLKEYAPIDNTTKLNSFDQMKVYTVLPSVAQQFDTNIS